MKRTLLDMNKELDAFFKKKMEHFGSEQTVFAIAITDDSITDSGVHKDCPGEHNFKFTSAIFSKVVMSELSSIKVTVRNKQQINEAIYRLVISEYEKYMGKGGALGWIMVFTNSLGLVTKFNSHNNGLARKVYKRKKLNKGDQILAKFYTDIGNIYEQIVICKFDYIEDLDVIIPDDAPHFTYTSSIRRKLTHNKELDSCS